MHDKMTRRDIARMEEEIEYRRLVVRKEALEAVKEARAQGDLSENFEYHAAKKDKNQNESRIRYLERMIKTAQIIDDESNADEAGLDNTVTVYFEEDDETETFRLVTTVRGNSLKGMISIDSPMGKAILGHKVGDRVTVKVNPDYSYDVIIKSIQNIDGSKERAKYEKKKKHLYRGDLLFVSSDRHIFASAASDRRLCVQSSESGADRADICAGAEK